MATCNSKKKGFTLVEILVVLGVISMVMLIGVSSYGLVRKKVKLDIAANSLSSTIVEAREKTKAGYYEDGSSEIADAKSLCFGFTLEKDGFIKLMTTEYDRLAQDGSKCDTQNAQELRSAEPEEDITVKDLVFYGDESKEEFTVFFAPPNADIEFERPLVAQDDPELKVVIGYMDSESNLDKRVVVFNLLTGAVYSETFIQNEQE